MLPGLHPGLMIARKTIEIVGAPQTLHISTSGGPGVRLLGASLELRGAPAPFFWEFDVEIHSGPWIPDPSQGSGTSNNGFVYFQFEVYHGDLGEYALQEVGTARFRVTASNGATASDDITITAGQ